MYITLDLIIKLSAALAAAGTGRLTLRQAWASLRPFNIGQRPMFRVRAIYPGSRSKPGTLPQAMCKGAMQSLTGHKGAGPRGCNGPCKDALARLDKHLNKSAHHPEL